MTPEERKVYMREYRNRKRAETVAQATNAPAMETRELKEVQLFEVSLDAPPKASRKHPAKVVDAPLFPKSDREYGLPRSNYYSDPSAPGGWTETIQRIDPHLAQRILDRIAPPRKMR